MRIDPKYFNHFMLTVAVTCIVVIAVTSFRYFGKQEERFLNRIEGQKLSDLIFLNHEGDTLQVNRNRTTVLLFWSTWSDRSMDALFDLYNWHDDFPDYEVIASYVKDSGEFAAVYDREEKEQFILVNGTPAYQDLRVPGIPTVIIFDSFGGIRAVEIGFREVPLWHKLSPGEQHQSKAQR